ncbi:terpenoid synthase [Epithele typhae]|uniref:terpenoid synthase n=1 Tax=Epithele typhae TaxID=378194 RepID=UPI002007C9EB|nr:terpenoid synthase [Epithele typhae]KAH9924336.1 terpenoid synthase [Epithele typhae]
MSTTRLSRKAAPPVPLVDCACSYTEASYGHLSSQHQRFVALYTACILYIDDLGGQQLEPVCQFASRLAGGQPQLTRALETLAGLLKEVHTLWPAYGADAIISGTLDAVSGMYLEYTTQEMEPNPIATWWPMYLRTRTGINAPYIHFMFMKGFRDTPETYLQILPLSFYKEELAGETKNYIHIRAQTEGRTAIEVLRLLAQEILESHRRVSLAFANDEELSALWLRYVEKFLEFHVHQPRYKLEKLLL